MQNNFKEIYSDFKKSVKGFYSDITTKIDLRDFNDLDQLGDNLQGQLKQGIDDRLEANKRFNHSNNIVENQIIEIKEFNGQMEIATQKLKEFNKIDDVNVNDVAELYNYIELYTINPKKDLNELERKKENAENRVNKLSEVEYKPAEELQKIKYSGLNNKDKLAEYRNVVLKSKIQINSLKLDTETIERNQKSLMNFANKTQSVFLSLKDKIGFRKDNLFNKITDKFNVEIDKTDRTVDSLNEVDLDELTDMTTLNEIQTQLNSIDYIHTPKLENDKVRIEDNLKDVGKTEDKKPKRRKQK